MDEETFEQFSLPHAEVEDALPYMQPSTSVQILVVGEQALGRPASRFGRAHRLGDRAGREGRHRLERDEAGDARDGRDRAGAALRQPRRADQGRSARRPLHLARLALGEYFTSFDDAWRAFLARTEPLESFYDEFTGGAFDGEVWVIEPSPEVKRAALRVQGELEPFDFLELVPHHFLHVAVPHAAVRGFDAPIDLEYSRVNCFPHRGRRARSRRRRCVRSIRRRRSCRT